MGRIFRLVQHAVRQIPDRDAGGVVPVKQHLIGAEPVAAALLAGFQEHGRGDEAPVEGDFTAQGGEAVASRQGPLFPLGREVRGIHQLHAGGDLQAAGTADHQQPAFGRDGGGHDGAGALEVLVVDVRGTPARVVGADHPIVPLDDPGQGLAVLGVHRHCGDLRVGGNLADVAHDGGDVVAAADGLLEDGGTDKTAGTDQGNFHGDSPSLLE